MVNLNICVEQAGHEVISNCRKRNYGWIGDLKPNRVILHDDKRMNVSDLLNSLRKRGQFTDTVIDGQIYQTVKIMAYIPSLKENVSIVINAKANTKDVHVLCTDLQEDVSTIFRYARKRVMIENSYKDAKQLGFGRVQVQKERIGAYTCAPSLSGLYSPANSQIQTAFVQDNKGSAVNGICHHVGQKENQTGIHPLHMGQIKTRRSSLQHVGTKSAKRKLKRLSGKERRFKKDTNHVISKHIISKAKGTTRTIGIENLKHIRSRVTVRRSQRDRHSKWAFGQLRDFLTYKTKREGVPLKVVKSENTSRQCPKCQHIDKRNRKTRNLFECLKCGYMEMADYVAAINIAVKAWPRAAVKQPIVGETLSTYKPPILIGGS